MKTRASAQAAKNANRARGSSFPVGGILLLAGERTPKGLLDCDGAAVSRLDYPELFEALGTTFGSGDGSSTFNVPTLAGPVPGTRFLVRCGSTREQLAEADSWQKSLD